jgi:hypothetical protein
MSLPLMLLLMTALLGALLLPGCGGCRKEDPVAKKKREAEERKKAEERRRKKKAEEPKPNFESMLMHVLPNYEPLPEKKEGEEGGDDERKKNDSPEASYAYVKPGHWVQVLTLLKANNYDFHGRLRTAPVDANGRPLDIERTNYRVSMFRPASLPKGQSKQADTLFFLPRRERGLRGAYNLRTELLSIRGGGLQHEGARLGTSLEDHEYFFVVLASNNSSYVYLNSLRSVVVTEDKLAEGGELRYYRVILPRIDRRVPLPSTFHAWTMIAYVLWDDIDPALMTEEQRTAMLDWLHWGGQLILSGPNTLDKLKGSFLAPFLPADAGAVRKLAQTDFEVINEHWSLPSTKNPAEVRRITILPDKPMLGVELKKRDDAQFVPATGELVAERRVGSGRIVVTAFPLTDLRIRYWKNFDGFFNGVLLRRPGRTFYSSDFGTLQMKWSMPAIESFVRDPRLASTLRIFSRDIGYLEGQEIPEAAAGPPPKRTEQQRDLRYRGFVVPGREPPPEPPVVFTSLMHPDIDDWHLTGYYGQQASGVGGWNDFSGAADAARDALEEAAKIEIPKADFVLKVLAVYLVVLVPLNWLIFWLLGRVEWAWAAAPVIAMVGAICVIRLAQLNIGFVRSRTEIAILEMQAGYPRAHVTRYTTLYTSLSTGYSASFDDPAGVCLPFVVDERYARKINEAPKYCEFHREKETTLTGIQVNSNSTEKIHSEHFLPLQGPISLSGDAVTGFRLKNATKLTLRDLGIIRRPPDASAPRFEVAYVAELRPQTSVVLQFTPYVPPRAESGPSAAPRSAPWVPQWDQSLVMSSKPMVSEADKGTVRLFRLVDLAVKRLHMSPGDVRLVAWTRDDLPGMRISPRPAQNTTQTLVLAHLARGPLPPPQRDANVSDDFKSPTFEEPDTEPATGTADIIDATKTGF